MIMTIARQKWRLYILLGSRRGLTYCVPDKTSPSKMYAILPILCLVLITINTGVFAAFNRSAIDLNEWWGPKDLQGKEDKSIRSAKIHFSASMVRDLKDRLKQHVPLEPPLNGSAFNYGFNSGAIDYWVKYWSEEYPFEEREAFLNQFPQYKTNIQGLDIHFIRVKPENPNNKLVLPLLVMHGWPGSIREFYGAIPLLTADSPDRDFVVEVVVPCLPGFGFSQATTKIGLGAVQMAVILRNLMHRLGHPQFYTQGGDWGGIIGSYIATIFPEENLGFHANWGVVLSSVGLNSLKPQAEIVLLKGGYLHLAATKPDTVGMALTDSPIGLLAFILEKFSGAVTNANNDLDDGGLKNTFPAVALIDDLMFYWTERKITNTLRLYAETFNKKTRALEIDEARSPVPIYVTQGKAEFTKQTPEILKTKYDNLLHASSLDVGNHFLALELPQVFTDNVFIALKAFLEFQKNGTSTQ
ncbi:alpha/beta hydrolase fold domain-containing protein [Phthorimaea operculella]|nr:alpha/beta hydrolase fold domain-containing protein [Phthorimaea operculella]